MALAKSVQRLQDLAGTLQCDKLSYGCHKADNTLFIACELELTPHLERGTAIEVFRNSGEREFPILSADIVQKIPGTSPTTSMCSPMIESP